MSPPPVKPRPTLVDRFYYFGVAIKGFDGLIEAVAGLLLLFFPSLPHTTLEGIAGRAVQYPAPFGPALSTYLEGLDADLVKSGSGILIAYLVAHGVIKLALVYCLLRRLHRAYPVALAVLGAFLLYQVYLLIVSPTVLLAAFSLLDAAIIFLVYKEYREIKGATSAPATLEKKL